MPFEILVDQHLPVITAHSSYLTQLFQSLLDNGIRFMDKPTGLITIRCEAKDPYWLFSVGDNGPGIDSKYHAKIFHIFETLNTKDIHERTGIGLALVKKIITYYGGEIWVESTLGKGSTFLFTLPKDDNVQPDETHF